MEEITRTLVLNVTKVLYSMCGAVKNMNEEVVTKGN